MRSDHLSHPHGSKLMGVAIEMRYLMRLSALESVQNLVKAPIDVFPSARRASMS